MAPPQRHLWVALSLLCAAPLLAESPPAPAEAPPVPPPLAVLRASGHITIDGKLDEPAWQGAAVVDKFFETFPADNTEPPVKTAVYLTYDDEALYIGVHAYDPDPTKIRAPYVERDNIVGTDDNVAIFLDTRNDRRSAIELRVNPRGNQADAVYDDATGNEDFSPDFFYDTAAQITSDGWTAEYRIPFSSLRYEQRPDMRWGILVWRNYPRDQRYAIHSSPIPRNSNCWICRARELTGLTGLPSGGHLVVAPYVSGRRTDETRAGLGTPLQNGHAKENVGGDVKWTPSASNALDATINPDFSQIESDIGQIGVNTQFALFFPEKRPFFLEGVDLFDTPIQAVYTRTITDPRWGVRDTGKLGGSTYTLLVTEDRGGGSVIIPGPTGSGLAPQDFSSTVTIGRLRHDFGASFGGFLVTDRENQGGGFNRVVGPDFLWRSSGADQVSGQLLYSSTQTPNRPDLEQSWNGQKLASHAGTLEWLHTARDWTWRATVQDFGEDFRADEGFVPQVGYRLGRYSLFRNFYPTTGFLRRFNPFVVVKYVASPHGGDPIQRQTLPGIQMSGAHNFFAEVDFDVKERLLVGGREIERSNITLNAQIDPGRRFSRIGGFVVLGDQIDFANARPGHGGELNLFGTLKPADRLALDWTTDRQWLDVTAASGQHGRLFTAQIERLKVTYNFTARSFMRVIGQYLDVRSTAALYTFPVRAHEGSFNGSALFGYRVNWQTVLFVGYGDDRALDPNATLQRQDRVVFVKLSYAIQR